LTDQELRTHLATVIVVIGIRARQCSQYQLTTSLDLCQIEILGYFDRIEHRAIGRDNALLLLRTREQQSHDCQKY